MFLNSYGLVDWMTLYLFWNHKALQADNGSFSFGVLPFLASRYGVSREAWYIFFDISTFLFECSKAGVGISFSQSDDLFQRQARQARGSSMQLASREPNGHTNLHTRRADNIGVDHRFDQSRRSSKMTRFPTQFDEMLANLPRSWSVECCDAGGLAMI